MSVEVIEATEAFKTTQVLEINMLMARITLFRYFEKNIFLKRIMKFQVKFCHHSGLRLWRTGILFSTKSKGHKSKFRISGMYRFCFFDLKVHFWWPNKCLFWGRSSWNTLYSVHILFCQIISNLKYISLNLFVFQWSKRKFRLNIFSLLLYYRHSSISAFLLSAIFNLMLFLILSYFPPLLYY